MRIDLVEWGFVIGRGHPKKMGHDAIMTEKIVDSRGATGRKPLPAAGA